MQAPDPHPHLTLFFGIWAAVGPLAGLYIGFLLTRREQHQQWLRDNRKEEFKEVVTAMSQFIIGHMVYVSSLGSDMPQSKQAYIDSYKTTSVVLCDRVYIHADLYSKDIPDRFLKIAEQYRDAGTEFNKINGQAGELLEELITLARKG